MYNPRKTMESHTRNDRDNGVNGSYSQEMEAAVSPGMDNHDGQVDPDRQQETVQGKLGLRCATWNVRTLYQVGKFENLKREMIRMKLDIMGVSEVRWPGVNKLETEGGCFIHSGGDIPERGVGIMLAKKITGSLIGFWAISDRVLLVKLKGNPIDINIIQVYAPTNESSDEEINQFYDNLNMAKQQCKNHEMIMIMGDLNAKVGRGREGDTVGPFGLGNRNERGNLWIEWCEENDQMIANTWFRLHPRRLYTWKSPGDNFRNQIDYITINKRFRNAILHVRTYPGADCDSDHNPVVAVIKLRLKKIKKRKIIPIMNLKELRKEDTRKRYSIAVKNRYEELVDEGDMDDLEKEWTCLQKAYVEKAEEIIPRKERRARQKWITDDILNLMEERRKFKNRNTLRYREVNREIKMKCSAAKERWINKQCDEIEELEKRDTQMMYERVKELTGKRRLRTGEVIMKKNGEIAMEKQEVVDRWKEYIQELFWDERPEQLELEVEMTGPDITEDEVEKAMRRMKGGKAVGEDGVAIEMLRALDRFSIEKITSIANGIYKRGEISEGMCRSFFITIPKKSGTLECNKHRTISIMSQILKIILKVVLERIRCKIRKEIAEEQYGFMEGKGTRNAIFILRMLSERSIEMQKDIYLCFIDYEKAFDRVKHEDLIAILKGIGVDGRDLRMVYKLYWNQKAAVRIGADQSDWMDIKRGVRQGCVLSPDLFSLYSEMIMRSIEGKEGLAIGGRNINNIRYADDTVLIADSQEKLQDILTTVKEASEAKGLTINVDKTEVMVISKKTQVPRCDVRVNDKTIKQVRRFCYLGSYITEDGRCTEEIKRRICEAKKAFQKMRNIITNSHLSIKTRQRTIKTYVWSVLLYGSEAWTLNKQMEKRLEAFEMWCWRRLLKISWTERISNEEVLRRMGVERELIVKIRTSQMRFIGHVMRRGKIEDLSLTGRIPGSRARGRQREKYMDGIVRTIGDGRRAASILQMTRDRGMWQSMVANVYRGTAPW